MTIKLYGTKGCHLCELAEQLCIQNGVKYEYVDIAEDDALVEKYAIRIPVAYCTKTHKELGWPFDAQSLTELG